MSMPEEQFDDELDDDAEGTNVVSQLRREVKQRDKELKALRDQASEAETLRKKLAVHEANLSNLTDEQQKAVLLTSAEMTADALRSQAEKLGFVEPPAPAAPTEDIQAFDRVSQAVASGNTTEATTYEAELDAARNENEMLAVMRKYNKPISN